MPQNPEPNPYCKCGHLKLAHDYICHIPYREYINCLCCSCQHFEESKP